MTTDTTSLPSRAEFEVWAKKEGYPIAYVPGGRDLDGEVVYADTRTHAAWWSWQSAIEPLRAEITRLKELGECTGAIESVGQPVEWGVLSHATPDEILAQLPEATRYLRPASAQPEGQGAEPFPVEAFLDYVQTLLQRMLEAPGTQITESWKDAIKPVLHALLTRTDAPEAGGIVRTPWRDAIDDALSVMHSTILQGETSKAAIDRLIAWHVQVALDPTVSSDAQALIDRGAAEPRVGWKLVPETLTGDMIDAVESYPFRPSGRDWQEIWRRALAAAPSAEPASGEAHDELTGRQAKKHASVIEMAGDMAVKFEIRSGPGTWIDPAFREDAATWAAAWHAAQPTEDEMIAKVVPAKDMDELAALPMTQTVYNAVHRVYFRAGLLACREYMARFVEAESPTIAASIRANWWPSLGDDPGAPRQNTWDELVNGGEEGPWTHKDVSPSVEALPIAFQFLLSLAAPPADRGAETPMGGEVSHE